MTAEDIKSGSSSAWDRGEKFWHYRQLESLQEYVLISQETRLIERYARQRDGTWVLKTVEGAKGVLRLKSIKCAAPLAELYENTGLPPAAKPRKIPLPPATRSVHKR